MPFLDRGCARAGKGYSGVDDLVVVHMSLSSILRWSETNGRLTPAVDQVNFHKEIKAGFSMTVNLKRPAS